MLINGVQQSLPVQDLQMLNEKSELQNGQSGVSAFGTEIVQEENVNFKKNPFNVYGKNIENFEKFKGKNKNDALNATNKAAANINNAYNKLKHDYPNVNVDFEEPPNPKDYGKRREGFQSYMQALERWEKTCNDAINEARKEQEALAPNNKGKGNEDVNPEPSQNVPPETEPVAEHKPNPTPTKAKAPKSKTHLPDKPTDEMPTLEELLASLKDKTNPESSGDLLNRLLVESNKKIEPKQPDNTPPSYLQSIENSPGTYVDTRNGRLVTWGKQFKEL